MYRGESACSDDRSQQSVCRQADIDPGKGLLRRMETRCQLLDRAAPSVPASTVSALARRHRVPGAQLAIHHGGATTLIEVGELESGSGRHVTREAVFPIGSITKCFTATVAMILVADGDVELDGPIGEYLPDLPELGDLGAAISLRHLLSHTSGLCDSSGTGEASGATPRGYVAHHVSRRTLVQPPGAGFSYSNPGYVLTGRIIETVTGMSWPEAIDSILLRPLGIEPVFVNLPGTGPSRRPLATGHSVNIPAGRTRPVRQSGEPAEAPAGALALSAADLVRLGRIHVGPGVPELLSAADAAQMRQPVPGADPVGLAGGWGLGLALYPQLNGDWAGHDGNADGTCCYLRMNPAEGWVLALTTNASTGVGLWQDVLAELARDGVPIDPIGEPLPGGRPIVPPPGCAGRYVNGDVEYTVGAGANGSVHVSLDGDRPVPLTLHGDLTFSLPHPDSGRRVFGGQFVREPATGKIYGLQVGGRLARKQVFARMWASAEQRYAPTG
jgi:CubicO group peptidase (beta-lactamase class C family)